MSVTKKKKKKKDGVLLSNLGNLLANPLRASVMGVSLHWAGKQHLVGGGGGKLNEEGRA